MNRPLFILQQAPPKLSLVSATNCICTKSVTARPRDFLSIAQLSLVGGERLHLRQVMTSLPRPCNSHVALVARDNALRDCAQGVLPCCAALPRPRHGSLDSSC